MNTRVIKTASQSVLFIFGAFGGFLLKIAPPDLDDDLNLPVGISQFIALCILLFLSFNFQPYRSKATAIPTDMKKRWGRICGFLFLGLLITSFLYFRSLALDTQWIQDWNSRIVKGHTLTMESVRICAEKGQSSEDCEGFLLTYYNEDEIVTESKLWTRESMETSKLKLFSFYILFVASLSSLLFSLVELISLKK